MTSQAYPTAPPSERGSHILLDDAACFPTARRLTKEQEQAYIDRARTGGTSARHGFLLSFQGYIHALAARYVRKWNAACIDYDDLVQEGHLAAAEHLEQALAHETPYAYLSKVIRGAIVQYCCDYSAPIRKPRPGRSKPPFSPLTVVSLDRPLAAEGQTSLLDLLPVFAQATAGRPRDYSALYVAIGRLPWRQRDVIIRHYGLDGGTPQTLYEISRHLQPHAKSHRRAKAYKYERKAIARLQAHLGSTYQGQRGQGSLPTSRGNSG